MPKKHMMKNEDLEQSIDAFPGPMILTDLEGKILVINKNLADVFQASREDLIGKSGFKYISKEVSQARSLLMEQIVKTKKSITHIDQERGRWWKTHFLPILNNSNEVVKHCCYIEDITKEKKEEEKTIHMKDTFYKAVIEHSMDINSVVSADGTAKLSSPAFFRLLGYDPEEELKANFMKYIHPDDVPEMSKLFKNILAHPNQVGTGVYRVRHKDGTYRLFESIYQNKLQDPNIQGIIVNSRDITERERFRKELVSQKNYLETIMNNAAEIIFTIKIEDQSIGIWNRAAERNTGLKHKELKGKSIHALRLFENYEELELYIKQMKNGKSKKLSQLVIKSLHNGTRLWDVSFASIENKNQITEIICVCLDVTSNSRIHEKLLSGVSYISSDSMKKQTQDIFKSLLMDGWTGYYITRFNREAKQEFPGLDIKIGIISMERYADNSICTLDELYKNIETFVKTHKHAVVLLDRLDYLISLFSFNEVIKTLYMINDTIKTNQSLFIVRINRLLYSTEQYAFFEEEFYTLSQSGEKSHPVT